MSETKISEAAIDSFERAYYLAWRESTISFPQRTTSCHVRQANRAALEAAIPHLHPQPAELAEQQGGALRDRTPADFAIEHAGYLANASTRLLKARGELDSLVMRRDEHDDVDDSDMHAAQDRVDEASDSVRSAIYEFEKRRDRALAATGKQQVGE